jgi:hypothetical protein
MAGRFRLSPALVIALIALFVSIGGVGYAASKIGTNQIKKGAVTTKKLHKNAVTDKKIKPLSVITGKLNNQAVVTNKIADGAVSSAKVDSSVLTSNTIGVPLAGANIGPDGTVRQFFNRVGGSPTVTHTANSGQYDLTFPGLEAHVLNSESVSLATVQSSNFGDIATVSSSGSNPRIRTSNANGTGVDRAFEYVIFQQSP